MFPEIVCKCFYSPTIVSYAYLMTVILTDYRKMEFQYCIVLISVGFIS